MAVTTLLTGYNDPTSNPDRFKSQIAPYAGQALSGVSNIATNFISSAFDESELSRGMGNFLSTGVSTALNTMGNNLMSGQDIGQEFGANIGNSMGNFALGIGTKYGTQAINNTLGDSGWSRGLTSGLGGAITSVGSSVLGNLSKGKAAFLGIKAIKAANAISKSEKAFLAAKAPAQKLAAGKSYAQALKNADKLGGTAKVGQLSKAAKMNIAGIAATVVGEGLNAAFGPSREYQGKYGNITKGMDTAYDVLEAAVGFVPGWGTLASGAMALNKGLSNVFGSTDAMTKTDAVLGSSFMPFFVKWSNTIGAKTTNTFNNLSWQNTERTNAFMQNAFGNLGDIFANARNTAGKTYGNFSKKAFRRALGDIAYANNAWDTILNMTRLNEYLNIRANDMASINSQKYALDIEGGINLIYRGKQGMKILSGTSNNIGMRLLSGAALNSSGMRLLSNAAL